MSDSGTSGKTMGAVLRLRNFRLLLVGEGISLLGDQFSLIALPWLVLQLTGDPLAVGTVLALAGIPRALFMLVGGALTDRFSPRRLMLLSNLMRMSLVGAQAALVLTDRMELWMLYVFALCFGVADAFFFPAQISIIPQLVDKEFLRAGNSLIQAVAQVSQIGGPVLAGLVIALLGAGHTAGSARDVYGIGIAFVIDALTFVASVITLWMIRPPRADAAGQAPDSAGQPGLLSSIGEGIGYVWRNATLRWVFLLTGAIDFLVVGPVLVGIPVLADTRLPEGALAFGISMSAWGGGSLLGIVAAGVLPQAPPQRLGTLVMLLVGSFGLDLLVMGLLPSTPVVALAAFAMGAASGYINIVFITWLQGRVPASMLGRIMSMVVFASVGLIPVSQALCGALVKVSITGVFLGAGALLPLLAARALLVPEVRHMGSEETMTTEAAGTPA